MSRYGSMVPMRDLPRFNDHPSHDKNGPLRLADVEGRRPAPIIVDLLHQTSDLVGRTSDGIRVLDFGCGRGDEVARLRRLGWNARGVDVNTIYIKNGTQYLGPGDERGPILVLLDEHGRSPFDDGSFDVVFTNQVIEHVHDLAPMLREICRVTSPEGVGIHLFPARWSIVEQHMLLPFVQWAPTDTLRRLVIGAGLSLGLGASYFADYSLVERTEIFSQYAETETFYRSTAAVRQSFQRLGMATACWTRRKFVRRGGIAERGAKLPLLGALGVWTYDTLWQSCVVTARSESLLRQLLIHASSGSGALGGRRGVNGKSPP
jgi:SAM-dependent methyltransferase